MALMLLLALLAGAPPQTSTDEIARRFCAALTSNDIRAFQALAANPADIEGRKWQSVRNLVVYDADCIEIESYRATTDESGIVIDVDGSGTGRNAMHERHPIPQRWYLTQTTVEDETAHTARQLIEAKSDEERRGIAEENEAILAEVARTISDDAPHTPTEAVRNAADFLVDWSQARGDTLTEAYAICIVARLASLVPDWVESERLYDIARRAAQRSQSCDAISYAAYYAGLTNRDVKKRDFYFEESAGLAESLERPRLALVSMFGLAGSRYASVDVAGCAALTDRMEMLSRRFGQREPEFRALNARASIASVITDYRLAMRSSYRAAIIARELLMPMHEAEAWDGIGDAASHLDPPDYKAAAEAHRLALRALPEGWDAIRGRMHGSLGFDLLHQGKVAEAALHVEPAVSVARKTGESLLDALWFAESVRRAQGRRDEAMALAREALTADQKDLHTAWAIKSDLGAMLIESGDRERGIEELRESIDLIEARRRLTTSSPLVRARYFASRADVYAQLLGALVDEGDAGEAFTVAEEMKARALDDYLSGEDDRAGWSEPEKARLRALNETIVALNRRIITASGTAEAEAKRELRAARAALDDFTEEVATRHPAAAAQAVVDPSHFVSTHRHSLVVEYAVLPHSIIAFVMRDGRIASRRIPARTEEVERLASSFARRIEQRDFRYERDARALYDALLRPIEPLVGTTKPLTIVPDAFLWRVPFDALIRRDGRFVVAERAIGYAPSITMLARSEKRRAVHPKKTLLALGDPQVTASTRRKAATYRNLAVGALPEAEREVRTLSDLYGRRDSTVLTREEAREAVFKQLAGRYRILHVATHGIVDDQSPQYSALVLARSPSDDEDGLLEMREIRDLHLHADLVVLSACDTAGGKLVAGEGVIGLSWAFLTAGCPTTVVSQWKADSRSTEELMIEFHRHLLAGDAKAEALREAKLTLMRAPEHAHPFYWALFVVLGAPR